MTAVSFSLGISIISLFNPLAINSNVSSLGFPFASKRAYSGPK